MVKSSKDDGVIETSVIRVTGQMPSDVCILWRFKRRIVVIDKGNQILDVWPI